MNMKLLKKISILFIFIFLLFPLKNVSAATPKYNYYKISLRSYAGEGLNVYKLKNGAEIDLSKPLFVVHEVTDGSNTYLGYCLHAGKQIKSESDLILHKGFGDLVNTAGKKLGTEQQKLLKNIVASGYQNGNKKLKGSVFDSSAQINADVGIKCKEKTVCNKIIATQLLVWETMEGDRTDYDLDGGNRELYNKFISTNSAIKKEYQQILSDAKDLTSAGKVPAAFGHTYELHWIDSLDSYTYATWNNSTKKYVKSTLNIGDYNFPLNDLKQVNDPVTMTIKNGELSIKSTAAVPSEKTYNFELIKGSTLEGSTTFRWYKFKDYPQFQDILMGDYTVSFKNSLKVKTESGNFRMAKYDFDSKKQIKGAKYSIYKCKSKGNCDKKATAVMDLTEKTYGAVKVTKSGLYKVVEDQAPAGYDKISPVYVTLKIEGGEAKIISHDYGTNDPKQINHGPTNTGSGNEYLRIYNKKESIAIKKVDGVTGKEIKGASFQIKDSKGNVLKFNKTQDGNYTYSTSGNQNTLVSSNLSTYYVSLLPAGKYTLVETNVPSPYILSSKQADRETYFKISVDKNGVYSYCTISSLSSNTCLASTNNVAIKVKNYTTKVTIDKTGTDGVKLSGVKFKLFDSSKSKQIILSSANGEYNYVQGQTGNAIELVTNAKGQIIINSLPEGSYYLQETEAAPGYQIASSVEWTGFKVQINTKLSNTSSIGKTTVQISNEAGTFNFYKIDEDGNYLNSGTFKLQVYNDSNGKYEDTALTYNSQKDAYSIDTTGKSDIYTFSPKNGIVTFINVNKAGKYRIVEIEAPEGFVLPTSSDAYVEFAINNDGYVNGNLTMINKKVVTGGGKEAQAELLINIQTGQTRIRYMVIIGVLLVAIVLLFILKNKLNKK